MKIKCINNKGYEYHLTVGKTYEVIKRNDKININSITWYYMIDDVNDILCFPKTYFKTLSEIRNEKIDKLLK